MTFRADDRMQQSGQKWAKGYEPAAPEGVAITEFESEASRLGLIPEQYEASRELKAWVTAFIVNDKGEEPKKGPRYDIVFVPERLLKAWGIVTMWGTDDIDETLVEAVPFSDMMSTTWQLK